MSNLIICRDTEVLGVAYFIIDLENKSMISFYQTVKNNVKLYRVYAENNNNSVVSVTHIMEDDPLYKIFKEFHPVQKVFRSVDKSHGNNFLLISPNDNLLEIICYQDAELKMNTYQDFNLLNGNNNDLFNILNYFWHYQNHNSKIELNELNDDIRKKYKVLCKNKSKVYYIPKK